jgi:transposase-like protein
MKKEPIKRYSQAFKQQVVREYETGASATSLAQRYGIGTHTTIKKWVKQYGRSGFRTETVVIQTVEDQLEVQEMKTRIAALESALAESVLENRMLAATLAVASTELKLDLKKNFGKPLSGKSSRRSK